VSAVIAQAVIARRAGFSPLRLLFFGIPVAAAGFLGMSWTSTYAGLVAALALQGFGQGLALPGISSALSLSVGDFEQGEVAGLNSASQALGRTLGPVFGTALYGIHLRMPYQLSTVLLILVLVVVILSPAVRRGVTAIPGN
jgi:MFS family permease